MARVSTCLPSTAWDKYDNLRAPGRVEKAVLNAIRSTMDIMLSSTTHCSIATPNDSVVWKNLIRGQLEVRSRLLSQHVNLTVELDHVYEIFKQMIEHDIRVVKLFVDAYIQEGTINFDNLANDMRDDDTPISTFFWMLDIKTLVFGMLDTKILIDEIINK